MLPFISRAGLPCIAMAAIAWLVLVAVLASRFNIPSADGILYSLPFAGARHPFDLGIPFLGGFGNYGTSWGHHWPGTMWIKGLLFSVLPYSRDADVVLLSLFQLLAATAAAAAVKAFTRNLWLTVAVWILLLSDRLLLLACAGNRFEPIAVAAVVGWFSLAFAWEQPLSRAGIWSVRAAVFLSAISHPYSLVMGALLAAYDLARCKRRGLPWRESAVRIGYFLSGCLAIALWFALQPEALRQFTANAHIQKSFYHDWNSVLSGLRNYQLEGGVFLWGAALAAGAALAGGLVRVSHATDRPDAFRFLAPALLVTVIAIHTVTRCENFTYLAFGTPFAAMTVAVFAGSFLSTASVNLSGRMAKAIPAAVFALILSCHIIILPYRVLQFVRAGCPDLKAELRSVLASLPPDKTIYIPHLMWPAASQEKDRSICWFTFPLASPPVVREEYESAAYVKAKAGDFLIVDNLAAAGVDRFGVHPTFPLLPPDPRRWEVHGSTKYLLPGSTPWGLDLTIYRFIGDH